SEDPENGFLPAVGKILRIVEPQGPGIRVDSGVTSGDEITIHYDPMIAKLIVYGRDRADAIRRMDAALSQYVIIGLTTNIQFLRDVINSPDFVHGNATTALIERRFADWHAPREPIPNKALIAAALSDLLTNQVAVARIEQDSDGDAFSPWLRGDGFRLGVG